VAMVVRAPDWATSSLAGTVFVGLYRKRHP